jgi:hypothetical protein
VAGLNINLWGGITMLVFAALFVAWARLRPIAVPVEQAAAQAAGEDSSPGE